MKIPVKPTRKEIQDANTFVKRLLQTPLNTAQETRKTEMAFKPKSEDMETIDLSEKQMGDWIIQQAADFDEVTTPWTPFTKEDCAKLESFYIVRAKLDTTGENGPFYTFDIWVKGWDVSQSLLFGKGNITHRDEIYEYVSRTKKPVGPCWLELVPSRNPKREPMALIHRGTNPAFAVDEAEIPF